MPRKQQDPIAHVLDYFESQPIDSVKTALQVVTAIVNRRGGGKAPAATKTTTKPRANRTAGPGPAPSTVGD